MDRHTVVSFYRMIKAGAAMQLQDNEFWEIAETKLLDERLIRYLNVAQVSEMYCGLGYCDRGSDELLDYIENYIVKHRKALTSEDIDYVARGQEALGRSNDILREALGEANRDLLRLA